MTTDRELLIHADRPCRFCRSLGFDADDCRFSHGHPAAELEGLARSLAGMFQETASPTDDQIAWYLEDAEAIFEDFSRTPKRWNVTKCSDRGEFAIKFAVNRVVYVIEDADGPCGSVRLSEWRKWQREAK